MFGSPFADRYRLGFAYMEKSTVKYILVLNEAINPYIEQILAT